MTNDYYKKMLELQRRLRESEEERMKLEERFSLLEHESRSRHETCINRLRMRYIEFLEEQQLRDERNHKLLVALDRVDSSLALISAKTNRLGIMRRQYEGASSLKNWYIDRRTNGSMAGDSGVASQNNEGQGLEESQRESVRNNKTDALITRIYPKITKRSLENMKTVTTTRNNVSPIEKPFDYRYDIQESENLRKISQKNSSSRSMIDNQSEIKSKLQSFHQNPRKYRFNDPYYNTSGYESINMKFPSKFSNENQDFVDIQRTTGKSSFLGEDPFFKNVSNYQNNSRSSENEILSSTKQIPSEFPKFIDILRENLDDEDDEANQIDDIVGNELEIYMNRIPRLYREADCAKSVDDIDQEQNTSGDLLNVTLSDDGVDLSVEERSRNGKKSPPEMGNIVDRLKLDPTNREIGKNKAANICVEESENSKEIRETKAAEGNEFVDSRSKDNEDANRNIPIESLEDNDEIVENIKERREMKSKEKLECDSRSQDIIENIKADDRSFDESKYKIVCGEENETGNHFNEYLEDLEAWNLNETIKSVQDSMISKDESDFIEKASKEDSSVERNSKQERESNVLGTNDPNIHSQKDDTVLEYDEDPNGSLKYRYEIDDQSHYQGYKNNEEESKYSGDLGKEYRADDDREDIVDANEQYVTETNRYAVDGNEEYVRDVQECLEGGIYNEDGNQEYPVDGAIDGSYPEAQEVYEENGLSVNQEFVSETDRREDYEEGHETSMVEIDRNENYGQGYEASVEVDENEGYEGSLGANKSQDCEKYENKVERNDGEGFEASVEGAKNQSYGEMYEASIEADENQSYRQEYENKVEPNRGEGFEASVEGDKNQGYDQGYENTAIFDYGEDYDERKDEAPIETYENRGEEIQMESHRDQEHETPVEHDESQNYDRGTYETQSNILQAEDSNEFLENNETNSIRESDIVKKDERLAKNTKDVIKSLLESDTESTIERNVSNSESDFDFN